MLNLRYVLSQEAPDSGFVERWRKGSLALFENEGFLPRIFTVQVGYSREAHAGAFPPEERIRELAVWEDGEDRQFEGQARLESFLYQNGEVSAQVVSDAGTIVVLSENYLPGWGVTCDAEPLPLRLSHGCIMSAEIPAGRHEVVFRYAPRSLTRGALLSGAALAVLIGLWWRGRARPSREPHPRMRK